MEYKTIFYKLDENVCTITLKTGETNNKLNSISICELTEAIKSANAEARVIVIRGNAEYFCGGGTIGDFRVQSGAQIAHFGKILGDLLITMKTCSIPIVSVVCGHALGGGLSLVEASDFVIADESATFAIPEITGGFCPAIALTSVCQVFTTKKAMEMALLGQAISASEAKTHGLITDFYPSEGIESAATTLVNTLKNSNPTALRVTKELHLSCQLESFKKQLALAKGTLVEFLTSKDAKEALESAQENRPAKWNNL